MRVRRVRFAVRKPAPTLKEGQGPLRAIADEAVSHSNIRFRSELTFPNAPTFVLLKPVTSPPDNGVPGGTARSVGIRDTPDAGDGGRVLHRNRYRSLEMITQTKSNAIDIRLLAEDEIGTVTGAGIHVGGVVAGASLGFMVLGAAVLTVAATSLIYDALK